VVVPTVAPFPDVVGLESVAGAATRNDTSTVAGGDELAYRRWNATGCSRGGHGDAGFDADQPNSAATEDAFQRGGHIAPRHRPLEHRTTSVGLIDLGGVERPQQLSLFDPKLPDGGFSSQQLLLESIRWCVEFGGEHEGTVPVGCARNPRQTGNLG
jgi:hypothetical protein